MRKDILMLGKMPPPIYGTSVWYEVVFAGDELFREDVEFCEIGVKRSLAQLARPNIMSVIRNLVRLIFVSVKILRTKPLIIHMPISQSQWAIVRDGIYIVVARAAHSKCILHLHGSNLSNVVNNSSKGLQPILSWLLRQAYAGVVLSSRFQYIFSSLGVNRTYIVRNGCDYPVASRIRKSVCNVLYLSNLQPAKGIEDVVAAVQQLRRQGVTITLNIAGAWRDGKTKEYIDKIMNEDEDGYRYHGVVSGEEKWLLYDRADVFVFVPRMPEGHPWVINEALASGLPIIATAVGMIEDAVENGVNGFIVSKGSPNDVAESLLTLVRDNNLLKRMSLASERKYKTKFTRSKMIEDLNAMFDMALK